MTPDSWKTLVRAYAPQVRVPVGILAEPLLLAIADVESSGGTNNVPRHEQAYDIGGFYWKRSPQVRRAVKMWGSFAACSYSSWQIMYPLALEMGLQESVDPVTLRQDEAALPWIVAALNVRVFGRGAANLKDVGDAWNSGSFTDASVPFEYIERLRSAYQARTVA